MDNRTPEQRRRNMQNIKQKNTKLELIFMKALREKGIWFTTHRTDVFSKPDIVFKRKKIAVFIDSDFWHGKKHVPKTNQEFWIARFERNRNRDIEVNAKLTEQGWTVLRFTEEEIKKELENSLHKVLVAVGHKQ